MPNEKIIFKKQTNNEESFSCFCLATVFSLLMAQSNGLRFSDWICVALVLCTLIDEKMNNQSELFINGHGINFC